MHTKDKLAGELRKAGLFKLADQAERGYYHDFLSPLDTPALQLLADLKAAGSAQALALRNRAMSGEFDASIQEAEDWSKTPEGKRLLDQARKPLKMILAPLLLASAVAVGAACYCGNSTPHEHEHGAYNGYEHPPAIDWAKLDRHHRPPKLDPATGAPLPWKRRT